MPLPQLWQPAAAGAELTAPDAGEYPLPYLDAADLRLPARRRGSRRLLVASARVRRSADGAHGGDLGARPSCRSRGRILDAAASRPHRTMAAKPALPASAG